MSEVVCYGQPDKRGCYTTIPALAFLNFMFSGLFIKPGSLPKWMGPWAPSMSFIRWAMQANFINLYKNTSTLPTKPVNTFQQFCILFGWGGKTKWYCFYMILIFIAVFRVASCLASGVSAKTRRNMRRGLRPVV